MVPRHDLAVQEMYMDDLYFIQTVTELQIYDIETPESVVYRGLFHEQGGVELIYGFLGISDLVSIRPLKKIYTFAKYFVLKTLPKLVSLRRKHLIV